ncbi:hypothetical protein BIW11_06756, partial [Tropilaelaps mercedesae]
MLFGNLQIIKRDGSDGSHFPITAETIFGSDPSADVKLNLIGVADRQCRIVPSSQTKKMWIEVLDDSCGETHINGAKVPAGESRELHDADILTVTDRQFKIFYPVSSIKSRTTKTPGNCLKAKRRSIFNRTPPSLDTTLTPTSNAQQQKQQQRQGNHAKSVEMSNVLSKSMGMRTTPKSLSPRPRKSILSAKKNLLVTRTPTMSPKVVTWGNNRYKSPERSPSPRKAVKMARYTISGTAALSSTAAIGKKRGIGTLEEEIKRKHLATSSPTRSVNGAPDGTLIRRRPTVGVIDNNITKKDQSVEATEALVAATGSTTVISESQASTSELAAQSEALSNVTIRSQGNKTKHPAIAIGSSHALIKPPTPPIKLADVLAEQEKTGLKASLFSTPTNIVEVIHQDKDSSRLNRQSNAIESPPKSIKNTGFSRNFPFNEQTSTASPQLAVTNLSMVTQPSDSFGSLSVSDVDMSLFDASVGNDSSVNVIIRNRRSSSASCFNASTPGEEPRGSTCLLNSTANEAVSDIDGSKMNTPKSARNSVAEKEFLTPQVTTRDQLRNSRTTDAGFNKPSTKKGAKNSNAKTPESQSAQKRLRGSDKDLGTEVICSQASVEEVNEVVIDQQAADLKVLQTKQEGTQPDKKTWAGVLKKSIASGSPFKLSKRKSLKHKIPSRPKQLMNPSRKITMAMEITAAAAASTTGHALSPQTIIVSNKKSKLDMKTFVTPLSKVRKSSLDMTLNVSPLKTPDNSDGILRAAAFVANIKTPLQDSESNFSENSSHEKLGTPLRRSPRNFLEGRANQSIVVGAKAGSCCAHILDTENHLDEMGNLGGMDGEDDTSPNNIVNLNVQEVPAQRKNFSANNLKNECSVKRSVQTPRVKNDFDITFRGVKKLGASPVETKSPNNNLDITFRGLKKLVTSPVKAKSPKNDLDITFGGVKKLLTTPNEVKSPKNDLDLTLRGVKKLFYTPTKVKSPKNDLDITFSGIKKLVDTPMEVKSPKNDLDICFDGVKKLMNTPYNVKSPSNSLDCSFKGLKRMLASPKQNAAQPNDSVLESVGYMMRSPVVATRIKRPSESPIASEAKRKKHKEREDTTSASLRNSEDILPNETIEDDGVSGLAEAKLFDDSLECLVRRGRRVLAIKAGTSTIGAINEVQEDKTAIKSMKKNIMVKSLQHCGKPVQEDSHSSQLESNEKDIKSTANTKTANCYSELNTLADVAVETYQQQNIKSTKRKGLKISSTTEVEEADESKVVSAIKETRPRRVKGDGPMEAVSQIVKPSGRRTRKGERQMTQPKVEIAANSLEDSKLRLRDIVKKESQAKSHNEEFNFEDTQAEDSEKGEGATKSSREIRRGKSPKRPAGQRGEPENLVKLAKGRKRTAIRNAVAVARSRQANSAEDSSEAGVTESEESALKVKPVMFTRRRGTRAVNESESNSLKGQRDKSNTVQNENSMSSETSEGMLEELEGRRVKNTIQRKKKFAQIPNSISADSTKNDNMNKSPKVRRGQRAASEKEKEEQKESGENYRGDLACYSEDVCTQNDIKKRRGRKAAEIPLLKINNVVEKVKRGNGRAKHAENKDTSSKLMNLDGIKEDVQRLKRGTRKVAKDNGQEREKNSTSAKTTNDVKMNASVAIQIMEEPIQEGIQMPRTRGTKSRDEEEETKVRGTTKAGTKRALEETPKKTARSKRRAIGATSDKKEQPETPAVTRVTRAHR